MNTTTQSALSKGQLAETIKATLSLNIAGYVFVKSNGRYYYFKRESPFPGAIDLMVICVYFTKGVISCELQSRLDQKIDKYVGGFFDRHTYLFNSKSEVYKQTELDPSQVFDSSYRFKKSVKALKATLYVMLGDLFRQGRKFIIDCDKRYSEPKFLCALNFVEHLEKDKEKFKKELIEECERIRQSKYFIRHHYMLEHPDYQELVMRLNRIYEPSSKPYIDNQYYAYSFLFGYYFGPVRRDKRNHLSGS
ncbi:hypothetical protein [Emticicia fontis]